MVRRTLPVTPLLLLGLLALLLPACGGLAPAAPAALPPVEAGSACALTPPNAEGPFYTPGSPAKSDFRPDSRGGEPLRLTGSVLDSDCLPLAGVRVDFWQTDGDGTYDNEGYRLRGHQVTDADGRYALDTVMPGLYPGRPAHLHVKLFAPDGRELLTTQLYFPGVGRADGLFDPALAVRVEDNGGAPLAVTFDFVLPG